ncbi:MAG: hypothetical protein HKN68_15170 [Saprospiraceae bacterium]|nr:hypothetical protein [Saprospiraceae bacterium]
MKPEKTFILLFMLWSVMIQAQPNQISKQVSEKFNSTDRVFDADLLKIERTKTLRSTNIESTVERASLYNLDLNLMNRIRGDSPDLLAMNFPVKGYGQMELQLFKADVFTEDFQVKIASDPSNSFAYEMGSYYWGIVKGDNQSIAAVTFSSEEMTGFIYTAGETYNLGKLNNKENDYVIYKESDLKIGSPLGCDVDDTKHLIGQRMEESSRVSNPNNCVNMYVEIDNDIVVGKGGVTQAVNYVSGVFSQVAILYANESINFQVSEILAWDTTDPYTGPSTSNYLNQFRDNLGGNYNGDLAHLVGYQGSGGIAYVDVLCNGFYGVGYSDINSSYALVPTYSWTIEVVTHEIGHNLGSRHTHDCVWNGNNTAIDGCGPAAGYGNSCGGGPLPASGTIMSYCHLVGGVGIDFNLGFGPQPGDLIRSEVYNATCLVPCSDPTTDDAGISAVIQPSGITCDATITPTVELTNFGSSILTSVTITYTIDGANNTTYNWTGSLTTSATTTVNLPSFPTTNGNHSFEASTSTPNGVADEDSSNDSSSSSFDKQDPQTYYSDADGDGFGDPASPLTACSQPNGYVDNNLDCNPNDGNIYPGGSCNDGEVCTTNDTYDANCNCSGTFQDSDGDGVCDANDVCPGGDDNIDSDGDGTPDFCDCNPAQASFSTNPLNHSGNGSSSTSYSFATGDKDPSFTISGLGAKVNGNPNNRFEDQVTITFVDGGGSSQTYGTFSGNNQSSVNVSITGEVQSVTVSLTNAINNNAVSVSLSSIDYCSSTPPCADADGDGVCDVDDVCPNFDDNLIGTPCDDNEACTINDIWGNDCLCAGTFADADGDGVCDADDICPGGDDNIDSDGDGIPDFCDNNCDVITSNFSPDPLSHSGSGNSSSTVSFPAGNRDVSFTINGLDAVTNGKPDNRYIDLVTVTYNDGNGSNINAGTFTGDLQNNVNVSISGPVQSVTVTLEDGYDGNPAGILSIDLSDVTSCAPVGSTVSGNLQPGLEATIYPNPASELIWINLENEVARAQVTITNLLGQQLMRRNIISSSQMMIPVRELGVDQQVVLIHINIPGQKSIVKKVLIVK